MLNVYEISTNNKLIINNTSIYIGLLPNNLSIKNLGFRFQSTAEGIYYIKLGSKKGTLNSGIEIEICSRRRCLLSSVHYISVLYLECGRGRV